MFFCFLLLDNIFIIKIKKNSYRSLANIDSKINIYAENLPILNNDTKNVIEYINETKIKNKKKYNFWKLLNKND